MADDAAPTIIVSSHLKALNGYGQNGWEGQSSDVGSKKTSSNFLPKCSLPTGDNGQTRKLGTTGKEAVVPVHPGMTAPRSGLNTAYKGGKR